LKSLSFLFEDYEVAVTKDAVCGNFDWLEFFYGGLATPDGKGRGEVVSYDGIHIHYWKLPKQEGGVVKIDNEFSTEMLKKHISVNA